MLQSEKLERCSGFTLIELLVSLSIIALLGALLMPAISSAREHALLIDCMSRERQLVQALTNYAALNRGKYPPNAAAPSPGWFWNDASLLGLQSDTSYATDQPGLNVGTIFTCPRDRSSVRTYAMNYWASSLVVITGSTARATNTRRGIFWSAAVRRGDRLVLISESWSCALVQSGIYKSANTIGYAGDDPASRFGANGGITPYNVGPWGTANCEIAYALHRAPSGGGGTQIVGQANIGFADGHVATESCGDLVNQSGQLTGVAYWSPLDFWGQ